MRLLRMFFRDMCRRQSCTGGVRVVCVCGLTMALVTGVVPLTDTQTAVAAGSGATETGASAGDASGDTGADPGDSGDTPAEGGGESAEDTGAEAERSDDADPDGRQEGVDDDYDGGETDSDRDVDDSDSPVAIAASLYGELDGLRKNDGWRGHLKHLNLKSEFSPRQERVSEGEELLLMPAPLPSYAIGDTFIYSDGSWERVNDLGRDSITWLNHRGRYSEGSPDFTFRRSRWESGTSAGQRSFSPTRFLFEEPAFSLWPLGLGNRSRFDEKGRWIGEDGLERVYNSYWRCDVEGAERVQVLAGEFDSWRISCARYPDSYSYPKVSALEYRTWYYAPEIQHWVLELREAQNGREKTKRELVAIVPDLSILTGEPKDSIEVQEQFQEVLESAGAGDTDLWMAASGRITISMTPQDRLLAQGNDCRKYEQQVQAGEYSKSYLGIACRSGEGLWTIPRM